MLSNPSVYRSDIDDGFIRNDTELLANPRGRPHHGFLLNSLNCKELLPVFIERGDQFGCQP